MNGSWRRQYPLGTTIAGPRVLKAKMVRQRSQTFKTPDVAVTETGPSVPAQQAYENLVRTAQVLGQDVTDLMSNHGISAKQYNVLRAIRRGGEGGLSVSQISEQMTDPRADVTRLMDRLVRDGLVDRQPDAADRRVVRTFLTEAGRALLQAIDAPLIATHRAQFAALSDAELSTLITLLRKARGE